MLIESVINKAKEKGVKISFVASGAGVGLFDLFRVPGCSEVMVEARYLYDERSYLNFFEANDMPDVKYVSQDMAKRMSIQMLLDRPGALAVAVTAAVKTDRERRGKNHAHVRIRDGVFHHDFHVPIEGETRDDQDRYLSDSVMKIIIEVLDR